MWTVLFLFELWWIVVHVIFITVNFVHACANNVNARTRQMNHAWINIHFSPYLSPTLRGTFVGRIRATCTSSSRALVDKRLRLDKLRYSCKSCSSCWVKNTFNPMGSDLETRGMSYYKWSPQKRSPRTVHGRIIGPPWDNPRRRKQSPLTVRGPPSCSLQTIHYEARKHRLESLGCE